MASVMATSVGVKQSTMVFPSHLHHVEWVQFPSPTRQAMALKPSTKKIC
ncbi:MAG: hypothetical protein J6S85_23950 [Methanobrevibacter sp.]|nr:hypothetical protein [Methanobrevibacter sp.]